jgi:MFS family permease
MTDTAKPPSTSPSTIGAAERRVALGTLIACCIAVCLGQTAIAIPSTLNGLFQASLHPTGSQLTWVSDASLLPVAVLELTFGAFGDLFGRKRLLIGGGALVAVGELVSASAHGMGVLLTGQALAGIGAAAIFPSSLAMVAAATTDPRRRAVAFAAWAASLAGGGFVAPVIGGLLGAHASWRWALITVALLALVSTAANLLARDSSSPRGRSLDPIGQATIALGLLALLFGVIQGPSDGWGSTRVITGFVVAAVFLALFVAAELRARSPLLHLNLFANRSFSVVSIATVLGMFSFLGTCYALSILLGPVQHRDPQHIAIAFLLTNGPTALLVPVTARLLHVTPPRWLLSAGFVLIAAGDLLLYPISVTDSSLPPKALPLILIGLGFTLAVSSATATAVNTVPARLTGMASATTSQLRDIGFTLGPALIGAVALSRAASSFGSSLESSALPPAVKGAAGQIASQNGPLAVNSLPPNSPPGAAAPLAMDALGNGYALGFLVCAIAALAAALLSGLALRGVPSGPVPEEFEVPLEAQGSLS